MGFKFMESGRGNNGESILECVPYDVMRLIKGTKE